MTLITNAKFDKGTRGYFKFDDENQRIVAAVKSIPAALKKFVDEEGVFDTTKYFNTFLEEMYEVIKSGKVELPEGLRLSTDYTPCEICKSHEDVIPQDVRCRHEKNCPEHQKKKQNPDYEEDCQCKVYTSPCISFTKIGKDLFRGAKLCF